MSTLILLRHGQSLWNKANLFTGWVDVPLSVEGIAEAINAGKSIAHIPIDCIYTSLLMRAQQTAMLAMSQHQTTKIPIIIHEEPQQMREWTKIFSEKTRDNTIPTYTDWRLNERHYGELQGKDKQEIRDIYGDEQVKIWRRSYDIAPPGGESLAMTAQRTLPCLDKRIIPELNAEKTVLVSAHGNSLRSIVMAIEKLSKEAVLELEIATGQPIIYEYQHATFKRIS